MDKNDLLRMMGQLSDKRGGLVTELQALTLKPVEEQRGLNSEESSKHDKLTAEIDAIDGKLVPLKAQLRALEEATRANEDNAEEINRANGNRRDIDPLGTDEYRSAFEGFLQSGTPIQLRALSGNTATKGEELIPTVLWNEIVAMIARKTVLMQIATVKTLNSRAKFAIQTGRTTAVPRAEGDAYTETDQTFGQAQVDILNLGALCKVTEELLDDSIGDVETQLQRDFAEAFAYAIELHGLKGTNGNADYNGKAPSGLIADITNTGTTDASLAYDFDDLILMEDEVPEVSAARGTYLTARKVRSTMRLLKDNEGRPLWQPSLQAGAPALFNGHPVVTSDAFTNPTLATHLVAIFGDFSEFEIYLRRNLTVRRLTERFSDTGHIGFRGSLRWDAVTRRPAAFRKLTLKA